MGGVGNGSLMTLEACSALEGRRMMDDSQRALLDYWIACHPAPAHLPARGDLDPLEIPPAVLPRLFLTEIVTAGDRHRYRLRLIGTALVQAAGRELTGWYVDEIERSADYVAYLTSLYAACEETARPVLAESREYTDIPLQARRTSRLVLPLAADGRTVDMFVGCHGWSRAPARLSSPPAGNPRTNGEPLFKADKCFVLDVPDVGAA